MSDPAISTRCLQRALFAQRLSPFSAAPSIPWPDGWATMPGLILASDSPSVARRDGPATSDADRAWDAYVDEFLRGYFAANPDFAVQAGRHEFDGQLPDWSEDGLRKEIARLHAEREKASAFTDEQLDERRRFERDYLISQIDDRSVLARSRRPAAHHPVLLFRCLGPRRVCCAGVRAARSPHQVVHGLREKCPPRAAADQGES